MRNADQDLGDPFRLADFPGASTQFNPGLSAHLVLDFDIRPRYSLGPARPQRFQDRLLGGPATGVMLDGRFPLGAVINFDTGENTVDKQDIMFVDHVRDPRTFDDVGSDSEYVHAVILTRRRLGRGAKFRRQWRGPVLLPPPESRGPAPVWIPAPAAAHGLQQKKSRQLPPELF